MSASVYSAVRSSPVSTPGWPRVAALAIVVGGLVATFAFKLVQGDAVAQLWGYVIALVVALFVRRPPNGKPPSAMWPVGVLAAGDVVPLVQAIGAGP